mgnify:FL=1
MFIVAVKACGDEDDGCDELNHLFILKKHAFFLSHHWWLATLAQKKIAKSAEICFAYKFKKKIDHAVSTSLLLKLRGQQKFIFRGGLHCNNLLQNYVKIVYIKRNQNCDQNHSFSTWLQHQAQ